MDSRQMIPCVHLPLEKKVFEELVPKAKDWALMHGAAMRSKTNFSTDSLNFAPFTLIPSTFPKREFEKAVAIQTILNELMHKVAHDREFLTETLSSTVQVDDFTRRLFHVYETVQGEGQAQGISLGLFRGDYLLDQFDKTSIKQVEFNTISVSFAGAGTQLSGLHRQNKYLRRLCFVVLKEAVVQRISAPSTGVVPRLLGPSAIGSRDLEPNFELEDEDHNGRHSNDGYRHYQDRCTY